jgi:hypothetical protein
LAWPQLRQQKVLFLSQVLPGWSPVLIEKEELTQIYVKRGLEPSLGTIRPNLPGRHFQIQWPTAVATCSFAFIIIFLTP